ncbi:thiamine transporter substrate binding subunit [Roseivivax jejudonensis]|uniref:Thiamine transporter substrate binding subunit n=1 Tax=Roseivivax jejudonensis TaxID=1529041 RepID=A0A1X7A5I1_9RHOB|nr:extracellular solute-binding protein [Roseivivax jejudonensis]SLN70723.1 thiamine transporter substrate binding subunit [Roseivivax jejudonensis]
MFNARLTVSAAALAMVAAPAAAQELTISVYGIAQDAFDEVLYTPFEEICDCELVVETGNNSERLAKLEANAANPVIDVIAFADSAALEAAEKDLLAPLDMAQLSNVDGIYDFAQDPLGNGMAVGYTFYGTSIVYRSEEVSIETWTDLFSEELAGRVALPNITTTQGPLTLYMIQRAIDAEKAEAGDFSDAIAMVAENRDRIVTFYERSSQIPQLLQQEEILASVVGRFAWPGISSIPLEVEWALPEGGQSGGLNVLAVVAGTEQTELAHQFIDYWLSEEIQTRIAEARVDSPVNTAVEVDEETAEALTYGPEMAESIHFLPPAVQMENRESWLDAWNTEIAR